MATALELITSSLRLLGAVASGETPDSAEQADALAVLNSLLESWNLQGLALYRKQNTVYTLVPSQQSYTIGSGADFDGDRPIALNGAYVTRGGIDYPLEVLTQSRWNEILLKGNESQIPCAIYYEADYPLGIMHIYETPLEALPITMAVNMQFSAIADVSDPVEFPPGYYRALRYALAVELSPEFPAIKLDRVVYDLAAESLGWIKARNRQQPETKFDPVLTGGGGVGLSDFLAGR